uniref:Uncharacterized protein n=1 Tax=Wuchereria bancrofti TaxID=6293 RepID=A0AAF5PH20_WUCBA
MYILDYELERGIVVEIKENFTNTPTWSWWCSGIITFCHQITGILSLIRCLQREK